MPIDNLTKVHANGAPLTPVMVMIAMVGAGRDHEVPAYARAHSAQITSWINAAIVCNTEFKVELLENELPEFPPTKLTLGGIPLVRDDKLFPDRVVIHNAEGKPVARIVSLAIPMGFDDYPALWNCKDQAEYEARVKNEGWLFE